MKTAQELRVGNVFMVGKDPMVVVKAEYSKGGRGASTVKMKMKNLLTNATSETVFRADDKFEDLVLERKEVTYSYFADPHYVWMDNEYNQYEVDADVMAEALKYLEDGMPAECSVLSLRLFDVFGNYRSYMVLGRNRASVSAVLPVLGWSWNYRVFNTY